MKTKTKPIDIAPTSNVVHLEDVHSFLTTTRKEKMLCIFGKPGLGKSQACEYLARQHNAFFFEVPVCPSPYGLVSALAIAMGVGCGNSTQATLSKLITEIKDRQQTIVFDEAGRLFHRRRDQLAETARYIHDAAGVPVVLTGMPDLKQSLGRYPQLADRIHFLEFLPWSKEDCNLVAEMCFSVKLQGDLLDALFAATKGNGRLVSRALEHIERHAAILGLDSIGLANWGDQPFLPKV